MKKRLAMLVLAGAMVTSSLTGCGLKDSATVATVAGDEIPAGLVPVLFPNRQHGQRHQNDLSLYYVRCYFPYH